MLSSGLINVNSGFTPYKIHYDNKTFHRDQCQFLNRHLTFTKKENPGSSGFEIVRMCNPLLISWPHYAPHQSGYPSGWMICADSDPFNAPCRQFYLDQAPIKESLEEVKLVNEDLNKAKDGNVNSFNVASHCTKKFQARIITSSSSRCNVPIKRGKHHLKFNVIKEESKDFLLTANYRYRNVFKAVIRRMHTCTRKKKESLTLVLQNAGYNINEIEHAYGRITYYKNAEKKGGKKRMSIRTIKEAAQEVSIYTYLLKDALSDMLEDWNARRLGRLTKKNVAIYQKVCSIYLKHIEELLSKKAKFD